LKGTTAAREENALKGKIPQTDPARNKAGMGDGGIIRREVEKTCGRNVLSEASSGIVDFTF
jgi:hypothetical protein